MVSKKLVKRASWVWLGMWLAFMMASWIAPANMPVAQAATDPVQVTQDNNAVKPVKAGQAAPNDKIVEGVFYATLGGQTPIYRRGSTDKNGKAEITQLEISEQLLTEAGGLETLNRQNVKVTGQLKPTRAGNPLLV